MKARIVNSLFNWGLVFIGISFIWKAVHGLDLEWWRYGLLLIGIVIMWVWGGIVTIDALVRQSKRRKQSKDGTGTWSDTPPENWATKNITAEDFEKKEAE